MTFSPLLPLLYFLPQPFVCAKNQYLTSFPDGQMFRAASTRLFPILIPGEGVRTFRENFFKKGIDFIEKWRYNVKLYEIAA
jgi:hypothetical protein